MRAANSTGPAAGLNAADRANTRATLYSVQSVCQPVNDDVNFRTLVVDVEDILADAIVTGGGRDLPSCYVHR